MHKKGQLTLFAIIGIVLLLTAGIVIYFTTKKISAPLEEIIAPEDVKPVHGYVSACLYDVGREAVTLLGQQGGYIYIQAEIEKTPTSYIPLDSFNMFKIPYWYYEGEDRVPTLAQMQGEASRYVKENIRRCTGDFSGFAKIYTVAEKGGILPETLFAEEEVIIRLKWPLDVATAEKTTSLKEYAARLPVRLKQMWELANRTMAYENKNEFFENLTVDLMAADDKIPMDGLTFSCSAERWHLREVRERLEKVLYYNLPFVRVENTQFIPFMEKRSAYEKLAVERERMIKDLEAGKGLREPKHTPSDAFEFFRMKLDVDIAPNDLKAGFQYLPEWGMALNAQPNDGGVLSSNLAKGASRFLRFLCINQWHFAYDVIYPIKMTIKDESAFKNEGFIFQFAFPVLINDNEGERKFFGLRRFEPVEFDTEFCNNVGAQFADIRVKGYSTGDLFAAELHGVNITYKCFNQECALGPTQADEGYYRLRTLLPGGCTNPFITASKEGYLPKTAQLTEERLDMTLTKLKKMNLSIIVHPYFAQAEQWLTEEEMSDKEASIRLSLKDEDLDQYKSYPADAAVELVEGTAKYDIDINLVSNGNLVGGYRAEALEIAYDDIAGAEKIVFHLVEFRPNPKDDKDRGEMMLFLLGESYQEALKPEFR